MAMLCVRMGCVWIYNYCNQVLLPIGHELSAGLVNASRGLKAAVDVIGRLLGKL